MSLKVIEIGAIQKLRYGFLFAFHSNYGAILYHMFDIVTYWSKIPKFNRVWSRRNFVKMFDDGKTRMIGLPYGEKNYDDMLSRFHLIPERYGQTDRQICYINIERQYADAR